MMGTISEVPMLVTARRRRNRQPLSLSLSHPSSAKAVMLNERKLWLCVLLQAIAESDPKYVSTEHGGKQGRQERERFSAEAKAFINSPEFETYCHMADIPVALMRKATPEKAQLALQYFLEPRVNLSEIAAELAGDNKSDMDWLDNE